MSRRSGAGAKNLVVFLFGVAILVVGTALQLGVQLLTWLMSLFQRKRTHAGADMAMQMNHGPTVVIGDNKLIFDVPATQSMPPPTGDAQYDALARHMTLNQWDEARSQLQRIAYTMLHASQAEKDRFTAVMKEFAARDPLLSQVLGTVMPIVRQQPGTLQSGIYKHLPGVDPEQARYALYFGEQLGLLRRVKKGNSYRLYEPGMIIDPEDAGKNKARPKPG